MYNKEESLIVMTLGDQTILNNITLSILIFFKLILAIKTFLQNTWLRIYQRDKLISKGLDL